VNSSLNEQQQSLFQFIIAIIVLVGGGLLMALIPTLSDKVFPVMTLAAGFYFSQAASKSGASTALQTLSVSAQTVDSAGTLNANATTQTPQDVGHIEKVQSSRSAAPDGNKPI